MFDAHDEPIAIRGKPFVVRKRFSESESTLSFFVGCPRAADGWIPGARGTVASLHAEVESPSGALHADGSRFPPYACPFGARRVWNGVSVRINDILVYEGERGRGVGSALLSRLELFASGLRRADGTPGSVLVYGVPAPETDSDGEMEKLLSFYRAGGYVTAGEFVEKAVGAG